jgi:protein CpxP
MKRVCVYLALAAALAFAANLAGQGAPAGQEPGGHGGGPGHMMMNPEAQLEHLSQQLKLTDDQKAKIKPILEDQSKKMQALHQDSSLSPEDMHSQMWQIRQGTMKQIRPLLNADQQKQFDTMSKGDHGPRGRYPQQAPPEQPAQPQ